MYLNWILKQILQRYQHDYKGAFVVSRLMQTLTLFHERILTMPSFMSLAGAVGYSAAISNITSLRAHQANYGCQATAARYQTITKPT